MHNAPLTMPKLGLTMTEGLLSEWLVKPGDSVAQGQVLFLVETDKTTNEIEAPASGTIVDLIVTPGETVPVGAVVALWTGPSQGGNSPEDIPAQPLPIASPAEAPRLKITPFARRLARIEGIDPAQIVGSGPRGRIQACDIRAIADARTTQPVRDPIAPPASGRRNLRALIAARVTRSKAEIPHFYVTADAGLDALLQLRGTLHDDPQTPRKLSVTTFIAIAVARALARQPEANAVWQNGQALALDRIAIGIAVDTPGGVVAPVIPVTGDIYDFASAMDAAVTRARDGRLSQADLGAAAIGISNVGMFGVRALTPIIDPDQAFMLGVGAPIPAFVPDAQGAGRAIRQATLTLACDHRLIDGAPAARLLGDIVSNLENPLRLLSPIGTILHRTSS